MNQLEQKSQTEEEEVGHIVRKIRKKKTENVSKTVRGSLFGTFFQPIRDRCK